MVEEEDGKLIEFKEEKFGCISNFFGGEGVGVVFANLDFFKKKFVQIILVSKNNSHIIVPH